MCACSTPGTAGSFTLFVMTFLAIVGVSLIFSPYTVLAMSHLIISVRSWVAPSIDFMAISTGNHVTPELMCTKILVIHLLPSLIGWYTIPIFILFSAISKVPTLYALIVLTSY